MRKVLILAPLLATMLLLGCSKKILPSIYRLDIQQGNIVTQDQLSRLEPGMEQRKVRFILGTPMLVDVFNQERWDYVYEFLPGGRGEPVRRNVALFFENELLTRIEGDVQTVPAGDPEARDRVVSVPDIPRETGFFSALNPFSKDPNPPRDSSFETPEPVAIEVIDEAQEKTAPPIVPMEATATPLREAEIGSPDELEAAGITKNYEKKEEEEDGGFFRNLAERFGFGDEETDEDDSAQ